MTINTLSINIVSKETDSEPQAKKLTKSHPNQNRPKTRQSDRA